MTQAVAGASEGKRAWKQPWLSSSLWDCILILSPAFITSAIALALRPQIDNSQFMPLWAWVTFVLVVDVAHVYATLFRTYLNYDSMRESKPLLFLIPIACWVTGFCLYRWDDMMFWRMLAYLAVFHFIRQQYGFAALYARKDPAEFERYKWLDHAIIYVSTLFPLAYWHTHLPRNFNWFVDGDFVAAIPAYILEVAAFIYLALAAMYVVKELFLLKKTGYLNIPKNLIVAGTALSWWVGIVALNSDIAFTMTNVITHGIPYMALVWLYHHRSAQTAGKRDNGNGGSFLNLLQTLVLAYAPLFVLFLIVLAYLEEGFWHGLVWREHLGFFAPFARLPAITDHTILAVLIPLLSLPQSTHYVLDGFIWRVKDRASNWSVSGKTSPVTDN